MQIKILKNFLINGLVSKLSRSIKTKNGKIVKKIIISPLAISSSIGFISTI